MTVLYNIIQIEVLKGMIGATRCDEKRVGDGKQFGQVTTSHIQYNEGESTK